jgi:hypothetical protein
VKIPLWLKIGWTLWVLIWLPVYWRHYGPQNFLWFCDLSSILTAVALWAESPLLFSWQAVSVLLVQSVMIVDMVGRVLSGVHLIGGTEYMWDPNNALYVRLFSLFHVVIPLIQIWMLRKLGYDRRALAAQVLTAWVILPISFCFRPDLDINWVWGPFDHAQHVVKPWTYFMACLIGYPLLLYIPSHLLLARLFREPERTA